MLYVEINQTRGISVRASLSIHRLRVLHLFTWCAERWTLHIPLCWRVGVVAVNLCVVELLVHLPLLSSITASSLAEHTLDLLGDARTLRLLGGVIAPVIRRARRVALGLVVLVLAGGGAECAYLGRGDQTSSGLAF